MKKQLLFSTAAVLVTSLGAAPSAISGNDGHHAHWCYDNAACAAGHWGDLKPEYAACKQGKEQSPIDIKSAKPGELKPIEFKYQAAPLAVLNNGHTIQVNLPQGSGATISGRDYQLAQFHFHAPSEHTLNGQRYPLEVHFVHKNARGELAVVGVFFKEGKENAALNPIWKAMPKDGGKEVKAEGVKIDAARLLPAERKYFHYDGSLTTPPCSEHVNWNVMAEPIEASKAQIAAFTALYQNNARPVQPVNGRALVVSKK